MKKIRKIIPAWLFFFPCMVLADGWFSQFYRPSYRTFRYGSSGGGYGGGGGGGLWGVLYVVMDILSQVVIILISLAVIFFLYGVLKFILAAGDENKRDDAKKILYYGIIGLFIMVSFWGIINIFRNTFDLDDYYVPYIPYLNDYGGVYEGGSENDSSEDGGTVDPGN